MDFKNIWFKFCSYVLKSKRESESISDKEWLFRDSLVEYFNLELGWDKQCIETEYVVPSGSSDKRCDIGSVVNVRGCLPFANQIS